MSRTKSLPENHRECRGCKLVKPLDEKHFSRHVSSRGGFRAQCIDCVRASNRYSDKTRAEALAKHKAMAKLEPGKRCNICEGLAHRVDGANCVRCGLPFADEPPVEPVLRRPYAWAV